MNTDISALSGGGAAGVVVIGGGHAGVEAAAAAARLGADVLLLSPDLDRLGHISCNPAIGGVGKGQLVREIDALGGLMALAADAAALQYKVLNRAQGPAVQSPRAQIDRHRYPRILQALLTAQPRVRLRQDAAIDLAVDPDGTIAGVRLASGAVVATRAVVVAAGTFLRARLHEGLRVESGGRRGEPPSDALSDTLQRLGVPLRRLRTDTTPRVDRRSVDFTALRPEPPDRDPEPFAHEPGPMPARAAPLAECYGTWTNDASRAAVLRAIQRGEAPAVTGRLAGAPPRYCPNIESKFHDFPDTPRHHVFVEPEGLDTVELYMNGFSTSIAPASQHELIRSLPGFARAEIVRCGYAVEYDAAVSGAFGGTLETKAVRGLFLAGQVCGTSGYEEAAGLGLLAGVNAALRARGAGDGELWRPGRDECYLGVLADDLATRDSDEPYRLFTSRAEHRLSLRADNADLRLTPAAARLGLVPPDRVRRVMALADEIAELRRALSERRGPDGQPLSQWVCRPGVEWETVAGLAPELAGRSPRAIRLAVTETRYAGYEVRHEAERRKLRAAAARRIPRDFDFRAVDGLSREAREKLDRYRPETLAQAGRLAGVGPSDLALLEKRLRNP